MKSKCNKTKENDILSEPILNVELRKSKQDYFKEYTLSTSNDEITNISAYLAFNRAELKDLIEDMLNSNKSIKGQLSLEFVYQKPLVNGEFQETSMHYGLSATDIYDSDDFLTTQFKTLILREKLNAPNAGSGWSFERCEHLTLRLSKNNSLNAGSYISPIIMNKKPCVNFENKDEYCFIYSIRLAVDVYKKKKLDHPKRVKQYEKYINDSIFSGYEYPMSLRDIRISVNNIPENGLLFFQRRKASVNLKVIQAYRLTCSL